MLLLICILAAVPSIYLALTQFMEYDGFWHVFVAQQDRWRNFWLDYKENDHPPLVYLLLKLVMHLGRSVFVYRSISLVSDLVCVYLVGRISQKLSLSKFTPWLTALAFGLSIGTIELSVSVRSYMLSIVFVLLAFYYLLDLVSLSALQSRTRIRVLFALSLMLAVSSHYVTFFYVAACGAVLAGAALLRWSSRSSSSWVADGLAFVPVAGLMAYFYFSHIRLHPVTVEDYLAPYFYSGNESKVAFLIRNLQNAFNFLGPLPVASLAIFLLIAAALALAGIAVLRFVRSRAVLPVIMLLILLAELAWAGLKGKYPFGGLLRQQYILFPFAVLSAGVAFDRLLALMPVRRLASALAIAAALLIVAAGEYRWESFPKVATPLFTEEMYRFEAAAPGAPAVLLDQFNLIAFFIHHHQWRWRFDRRLAIASGLDEYTVERTGSPFIVIRDRAHWNLDFKDPSLFRDIAQTMRSASLTSLAVFCVHQYPGTLTPDQQNSLRRTVYQLAAAENLDVGNLVLDGLNVYARFGRALKTGIHPVSATYGANCGAPAGNATADFQRQCDDAKVCNYVVDFSVLGDPKRGCLKDFQASWRCGKKPDLRTAALPPEAGFRSTIAISCPADE